MNFVPPINHLPAQRAHRHAHQAVSPGHEKAVRGITRGKCRQTAQHFSFAYFVSLSLLSLLSLLFLHLHSSCLALWSALAYAYRVSPCCGQVHALFPLIHCAHCTRLYPCILSPFPRGDYLQCAGGRVSAKVSTASGGKSIVDRASMDDDNDNELPIAMPSSSSFQVWSTINTSPRNTIKAPPTRTQSLLGWDQVRC